MNALESIITWRRYLRNRLHRVLQRGGWEALNRPVMLGGQSKTGVSLVQDLDFTQLSHCHSIERFALKTPEDAQRFRRNVLEHLPQDQGPEVFAGKLQDHFAIMVEFIESLSARDCDKQLETPMFTGPITIQWLLEFGNYYEQSITSRIITILTQQDPTFRVPWPTTMFLKPVKKPEI